MELGGLEPPTSWVRFLTSMGLGGREGGQDEPGKPELSGSDLDRFPPLPGATCQSLANHLPKTGLDDWRKRLGERVGRPSARLAKQKSGAQLVARVGNHLSRVDDAAPPQVSVTTVRGTSSWSTIVLKDRSAAPRESTLRSTRYSPNRSSACPARVSRAGAQRSGPATRTLFA
jgi:hypothetical protein